ncbi:MAG: prephenate dehydrogenase [Candidatus Azotimanducaceae bacterium]|jgi:prephenate dehydrogenase
MINRLAIIGVGLIGSSLALALKQAKAVGHVVGCGRSQTNLQKGIQLGVIDSYCDSVAEAVKNADVVVIAVPLGTMQSIFEQMSSVISNDTIVTDVGSTKGSVIEAARAGLGARLRQFVPGHPIAGSEKSGVEAGTAELYQNRKIILTPLQENTQLSIDKISDMWRQCGAQIEYLSVIQHDKVLAATSHLPHLLAFSMVNYLSGLNDHDEIFKYAAGGFRDFTRIASSDSVMWRDICLANGDALVELIDGYKKELDEVAEAIKHQDAEKLLQLFGKAKLERDTLVGNC